MQIIKKKKLPKNIKNKNYSSKTIDLKNNKNIFSWFNLVQNKRKKFDFIKYKSLLGKKIQIKKYFSIMILDFLYIILNK